MYHLQSIVHCAQEVLCNRTIIAGSALNSGAYFVLNPLCVDSCSYYISIFFFPLKIFFYIFIPFVKAVTVYTNCHIGKGMLHSNIAYVTVMQKESKQGTFHKQ